MKTSVQSPIAFIYKYKELMHKNKRNDMQKKNNRDTQIHREKPILDLV